MANHKKKRPLNRRGHCKLCKPWKINGMSHENPEFEKHSDHKRRVLAKKDAELSWGEIMEQVLEERSDVWQALADLDTGKITLKDIELKEINNRKKTEAKMTLEEFLKLFERACDRKEWGDTSHMILYNDGSGYIVDKDGDRLFDFEEIEELIQGLKG